MADQENKNANKNQNNQQASVAFALTLVKALNGIINYTSKEGRYHYVEGTKVLEAELFNANPEDLFGFLKSLSRRARAYGWDDEVNGTLQILEDPLNPQSPTLSLIDNYGTISLNTIRKFDEPYIFNQSRAAQDNAIIFTCLMNSLTILGKKKVNVCEEEYMIAHPQNPSREEQLANALLKIIVCVSHINTNATTAAIKTKLQNLDKFLC